MKAQRRAEYATRDKLLKLLSDEELGRVTRAESTTELSAGDEYVDLGQLDRGILRAQGTTFVMGRVLPKRAVRDVTWAQVLVELAAFTNPASRA